MKRGTWWILLAAYAALVAYRSHQPLGLASPPFPHFDKVAHFGEYFLFLGLAWQATGRRWRYAALLAAAFAVSDEIHQAFVPTRHADILDLLADWSGILAGVLVFPRVALLWRFLRARILH